MPSTECSHMETEEKEDDEKKNGICIWIRTLISLIAVYYVLELVFPWTKKKTLEKQFVCRRNINPRYWKRKKNDILDLFQFQMESLAQPAPIKFIINCDKVKQVVENCRESDKKWAQWPLEYFRFFDLRTFVGRNTTRFSHSGLVFISSAEHETIILLHTEYRTTHIYTLYLYLLWQLRAPSFINFN